MSRLATVVIPCGPRHVDLLPRAIRSARAQTIPVDVLWHIDTQRKGPAYGRNLLVAQVKTPFVITLDADDYLMPNFVERTFAAWEPGSFVYTNWVQDDGRERQAISCYGFRPEPGEAPFFLPPTLFPTELYRHIGGQDETLFGAEDTDFYWKANARGIHAICLREPLLHYTSDGFRAREAREQAGWKDLMRRIGNRYKESMSMGCCGKKPKVEVQIMTAPEDQMLVVTTQKAALEVFGAATGKFYGWKSSVTPFLIDKRDFNPRHFTEHKAPAQVGPTSKPEIKFEFAETLKVEGKDLTDAKELEPIIAKAGVVHWGKGPGGANVHEGYGIQQTPSELAAFIADVEAYYAGHDEPISVLEVGTGTGGLARFFVDVLGWVVTSIDKVAPPAEVKAHLEGTGSWEFIESDSQAVDLDDLEAFDVVFLDAGHEYAEAKADWEKYSGLAPVVAMHDIDPAGWWPGSAEFWQELAISKGGPTKGNLKKGYKQALTAKSKQGLGWYVRD